MVYPWFDSTGRHWDIVSLKEKHMMFNVYILLWSPILGRFARENDWAIANKVPVSMCEAKMIADEIGPPDPKYRGQGDSVHALKIVEVNQSP